MCVCLIFDRFKMTLPLRHLLLQIHEWDYLKTIQCTRSSNYLVLLLHTSETNSFRRVPEAICIDCVRGIQPAAQDVSMIGKKNYSFNFKRETYSST